MDGWPPETGPEWPGIVDGPGPEPGALGGLGSDGVGMSDDGPGEAWVDVDDGTIFIIVHVHVHVTRVKIVCRLT